MVSVPDFGEKKGFGSTSTEKKKRKPEKIVSSRYGNPNRRGEMCLKHIRKASI